MSVPDLRALVGQGWEHLKAQRPMAARASWQQAIRLLPDDPAALRALEILAGSEELPASARAEYRFQTPDDPLRRARWNQTLQGQGLDDLEAARSAFESLAAEEPGDAAARLNLALCQAWLGRNVQAVATLEEAVRLLAQADPERASQAWTLAEVLRQGGGAESIADDLRHLWIVDPPPSPDLSEGLLSRWPNLREVEAPRDPISGEPALPRARVFEWLDRPWSDSLPLRPEGMIRVLATLVVAPGSFRLSTPDPSGYATLDDPGFAEVEALLSTGRREASPLPLAWADAALGAFRMPPGLDDPSRSALARGAVEHFFENVWIHQPRRALDGMTPLEASQGDAESLAKLAGVVRHREQLGGRSTHTGLYQGYPFDRLRRRLGLIGPDQSAALDADDVSCMSGKELDALGLALLEGPRRDDLVASANGLRDDRRSAVFAAGWLASNPVAFEGLNPSSLIAPLIREALRLGQVDSAITILEKIRPLTKDDPLARSLFSVWAAEIHSRTGAAEKALEAYLGVLSDFGEAEGASQALDAAETLLDNGHSSQALLLLEEARNRAIAAGDPYLRRRSEALLDALAEPEDLA